MHIIKLNKIPWGQSALLHSVTCILKSFNNVFLETPHEMNAELMFKGYHKLKVKGH